MSDQSGRVFSPPKSWRMKHAKVCRYARDERYGLDVDGCCRCRYLHRVAGPRPGSEEASAS